MLRDLAMGFRNHAPSELALDGVSGITYAQQEAAFGLILAQAPPRIDFWAPMALSLHQVQRQTQQLIMTPQMQQSIQMLQMNTQDLEQLTQAELEENPFLQLDEEADDTNLTPNEPSTEDVLADYAAPEALAPDEPAGDFLEPIERELNTTSSEIDRALGVTSSETSDAISNEGVVLNGAAPEGLEFSKGEDFEDAAVEEPPLIEKPEHFDEVDLSWDDYYDDSENRASTQEDAEEVRDFTEYTASRISLYEHLLRQIRLSVLEGIGQEVGEYLVGCIDDDGYLPAESLEDAAQKFNVPLVDVERVLSIIQEFEPVGIAARTASECLLIQLKATGGYSEIARRALEEHFEELQRKKFRPLAKALDVEEKVIAEIHRKVSRLEPRPGRAYSIESPQYIEPDVVVKLIDDEVAVYLNEGRGSQISINRFYRRMLRAQSSALSAEEKNYAQDKFRNALLLIKNIERRKSTILRVTEAIMKVQREFLDKGVEAMKPLTLREIADAVGMHESTVARVTSKKYVETPQGVFSLKYFFSSGIGKSATTSDVSSDAVSSRAIKDKLAEIIEAEDPRRPISDQKIADLLNRQGFEIARRTVAKYREQIKILPAKLRRKS